MANKFKDLAKRIKKLQKEFPKIYNEGLRSAASAMGDILIEDATPIQTGRLAQNWQPSRSSQSARYDERATGTEQSAKSNLQRKIDKFQITQENPKMFLNNAAPYAFAKLDRNKVKGAINDPAVRQAVRKTIKEEFKKAMSKS